MVLRNSGFRESLAIARTLADCRKKLITVLEKWIILKLRDGGIVPEVDGLSVEITRVAVA